PDALTRHLKALADLFQSVLGAVLKAKAHFDHALFARGQGTQHLRGILLQIYADHRLGWRDRLAIFNEIPQMGIFFLADWRFERDRLLGDLEHLAYLGH